MFSDKVARALIGMECSREAKRALLNLSGSSTETVFEEEAVQDLSISGELERLETTKNGAFDSDKIPSVFQFNCNDSDGLTNASARSMKRFERGLGVTLVRSDDIELKPVSFNFIKIALRSVIVINSAQS